MGEVPMAWRRGPDATRAYLVQWAGPVDAWIYVTKWMCDRDLFPRLLDDDMDDVCEVLAVGRLA